MLILMGIMMVMGGMNHFTGYLNFLTSSNIPPVLIFSSEASLTEITAASQSPAEQASPSAFLDSKTNGTDDVAPDFMLIEQNGEEHTLSANKGYVVFLNFWTTWCCYCLEEIPNIQNFYKEYSINEESVVLWQ